MKNTTNTDTIYFTSCNNFYNATEALKLANLLGITFVKNDKTHWISLEYNNKPMTNLSFYDIRDVHSFLYGIQAERNRIK